MNKNAELVIIGAGAAGLLAAVAAARLGIKALVLESSELVGGDTATGSGQMWLPATHLAATAGIFDSVENAVEYLGTILGEETQASTSIRRAVFANTAPKLARWLAASNLPLTLDRGVPDYHPADAGGLPEGRVVTTVPTDRRSLGDWAEKLRSKSPVEEASHLKQFVRAFTGSEGHAATGGEALVAELLRRATANGVEIRLDAQIISLENNDGIEVGVHVEGEDEILRPKALLLSAGGFAGSQELREEYLPLPTNAEWSLMSHNTGKLLKLAAGLGAQLSAMNDAWWTPVTVIDGRAYSLDAARKAPHSLIVDQAGDRYIDEAAPGAQIVNRQYQRSRGTRTIPSYLIMDQRHRKAVGLGPWAAGDTKGESEDLYSAKTLGGLADLLGIDEPGFLGTVVRFNGFAHKGEDQDFHRGESVWDRYALAHSKHAHVASLGKLTKKPYWAVKVYPGDEGTKGGLLIDENSQVIDTQGETIPGFYACGGAAASIMKGTSPGPGAALSEALVEAYLAVIHFSKHRGLG